MDDALGSSPEWAESVKVNHQGKVYTMGLTKGHVVENETMTADELLYAIILTLPIELTGSVDEKANGLAPNFVRSKLVNARVRQTR